MNKVEMLVEGVDPMLTPCIFKRGLVWILFFVLSLVVIPFFSDEGQTPPANPPAANAAAQP
ncbi:MULTISPECIES: hypothetical protein [Brevibacillus]|jgi:hypothetical protein|uniref:Uncharacterized protein n=1 Tax=Brevibacillus parabrevis TaxID=54914 RepID=A0A4Y3PKS8_BREPA|nr:MULTISPECIES: hypothetical protein [Brevibacillus]TGU92500.1 hypothetical protein EN829_060640 [Mesorhizobium sp. M00.F.Ca.ET.186.01.1.1]MBU8713956.1 hypothetical protein [Brevibacillus parabrevis]MDH6350584.1 hypothetical protein [Brevibacillus sp. 1238]MDR4998365.1 hypothetical protein [Brevibacillus parabrevis]MED1723028.1 hypothetical protein [Brevibacillus parabrevis]